MKPLARSYARTLSLLLAAVLFAGGYWLTDAVESHRVWREDQNLRRAPVSAAMDDAPRAARTAGSGIRFEDVALQFGVDFPYYDGAEGNYYLFETTGGGMAVFDYDGDGAQDVFFVNGARVPVDPSDTSHVSRLYRNRPPLGFDDTTDQARVGLVAYGQGACAADYDNDGFEDLLVTSVGRNLLFHNEGDGTFREMTDDAGVASPFWGTSAAFADLDQDGSLDLYVSTYADVPLDDPLVCERGGKRMHCLPTRYKPQADLFYHSAGDGRFTESAASAGLRDETGRGLGLAIADFDRDGRPDIFVANDTSENFLFLNQGGLRFEESALARGVALTGAGATMSGMGVACADYDLNGYLDLFVTNFYQEKCVLYQNLGLGGFLEVADAAGLGAASRDRLGFGTIFLDADLDGLPDLFVANGHVSDMTSLGVPYRMRPQLFRNRGNATFQDISDSCGSYFRQRRLGRGVAWADFNNDGLPDVVVSQIGEPAAILINRTAPHGHWLGLELTGTASNRDGRNAQVTVTVGGRERFYELVAGAGYLSSSDKRLLIGLGAENKAEKVVVRWPSGTEQRLGTLPADRYHRVREP